MARHLRDKRFGMLPLGNAQVAVAGARLYARDRLRSIWFVRRLGRHVVARPRWPSGRVRQGSASIVSRDDPLTAYAWTTDAVDDRQGEMRTRDGGAAWQAARAPAESGRSDHVGSLPAIRCTSSSGGAPSESSDGGVTWTYVAAMASSARSRRWPMRRARRASGSCDGWRSYDPLRPLAAGPLPYAQGLRGSRTLPARTRSSGDKLLGDAQSGHLELDVPARRHRRHRAR